MATRGVGPRPWMPSALVIVSGCGALAATFVRWHTGVEGVYFNRSIGAPSYAGAFGAFGENAWSAFSGLAVALAVFAALAAAVVLAIFRAPAERINLIAVTTSTIGL